MENQQARAMFASKVQPWHIKPAAIIFNFSTAVGTRPLTKQTARLKQVVVQCNPYLQNDIMY